MKYKVSLNNKIYEVVVEKGEAILESEYDAVAPSAPQAVAAVVAPVAVAPQAALVAAGSGNTFNSPLPGTILAIKCEAGQSYKAGTAVFIVESMKMENEVTLDKDSTIAAVLVTKGQTIQSGTPLCSLK